MTDDIHVRRAVIHIKLPITCAVCGAKALSELIAVELEHLLVSQLEDAIRRQRLGTHFPVGWGKYHGVPHDILKCPNCVT